MEEKQIIEFQEKIGISEIADYGNIAGEFKLNKTVVFDLRKTIDMHSSFIGFLINMKHTITKENGTLILQLSFTAERILSMLNILDYFSPDIETYINRKSA